MDSPHLLAINGLSVTFDSTRGPVRALSSVDLDVDDGETVAIMGESGCGKSVLGHASMRLLDDIATVTGSVKFRDMDIYHMDKATLEGLRGRKISLIPQNPSSAFNPVIRIGHQIKELIEKSGTAKGEEARGRTLEYLALAGFSDPQSIYNSYPHRLSGGMCERALIAMAVSVEPDLIIADEPTKGLDVPAKKAVLDLLHKISGGAALIMITHDFKAAMTCERMIIMYSGEIVEAGKSSDLVGEPGHRYLRGLLDAQPSRGMKPVMGRNTAVSGVFTGCSFKDRCEAADAICQAHPDLRPISGIHFVRCHHV
jgi:peptide/nickel transport system ATP-binding protein